LARLVVVFGDIGTSPIYTIQTVFNPGDPHPVRSPQTRVRRRVDDLLVRDDHRHPDVRDAGDARRQRRRRRDHGTDHAAAAWFRYRGRRAAMFPAGLGLFGAALFSATA